MKKIVVLMMLFAISSFAQKIVSSGEVLVNGKQVNKQTVIKIGDFIETKKSGKIKFNIGKDAFAAKQNSKFNFKIKNDKKILNVVAGSVLSVFKKGEGKHEVQTNNMTAGIRGTGVFIQHDEKENKSYFCTCYGETHLKTDKKEMRFLADHHNMVWIKADGTVKNESKMVDHDDDDLRDLEAFVGRIPEFDQK